MKFKVVKIPEVEEEINNLSKIQQEILENDYNIIESEGLEFVYVKCLEKKLYEIKSNDLRSIFKFEEGRIIVVGVVFVKKTQKTPKEKLKLARKRLKIVSR